MPTLLYILETFLDNEIDFGRRETMRVVIHRNSEPYVVGFTALQNDSLEQPDDLGAYYEEWPTVDLVLQVNLA